MNKIKLALIAIAAFLALWLGVSIGTQGIGLGETLAIIGHKLLGLPLAEGIAPTAVAIIWEVRLPRVLLAFLVGGALSMSGSVMQSLLQNPLASPYTLGVSSGASLGVGLAIVFFGSSLAGIFTYPIVGMAFGIVALLLVVGFSRSVDKRMSGNTVILAGMVFSLFLNALLMLLSALAQDELKSIVLWQMGSFALKGYSYVLVMIPFYLFGLFALLASSRRLDVLTLGDEQAASIGVNVKGAKSQLFLLGGMLTGASVSLSGIVGFVDLIAPHVTRKLVGARHKLVIPASALVGGIMMVISDLVARMAVDGMELPVGAVTAILGTPFFAYIYFRNRG